MSLLNEIEWNEFLAAYPDAHLLQTAAWGNLKSAFGWQTERLVVDSDGGFTGAQVLFRRLPLGFSLAYIGKGPVGAGCSPDSLVDQHQLTGGRPFWTAVDELCRRRRVVFLKVEPDIWQASPDSEVPAGFRLSPHTIQPPRTLVIDLRGEEDQLLARMKQKTRYNIRLALRKGIVVRRSADLTAFYRLMQVTGSRDGFGVHSLNYFQQAYDLFHPQGQCELLMAEYEGEPLAGLMVFARGRRAWYFYGASSDAHRERMPAYLLQWEAMRWARAQDCQVYDLWGVPDAEETVLEAHFTEKSEGLWGVYRFKRGFGGDLKRSPGPWDRVYNPLAYTVYRLWARRSPSRGAGG